MREKEEDVNMSETLVSSSLAKRGGGAKAFSFLCVPGITQTPAVKMENCVEVPCAEVKALLARDSQLDIFPSLFLPFVDCLSFSS